MRYPKEVLMKEVNKIRTKGTYTTKQQFKTLKKLAEIRLDAKHFTQGIYSFKSKNPCNATVEKRVLGWSGWLRAYGR